MGKLAFLFPGQGSQQVGMGRSFHDCFPQARTVFEHAEAILGFPLTRLCFEGPEDELRSTVNAQPALFTVNVAAWNCFEAVTGLKPDICAGHSLGEYAALVAAGSLDFADGLRLVRRRGELMAEAAARTAGRMAALMGIEPEAALQACDAARKRVGGVVTVANYNGGGQIVISGDEPSIEEAIRVAKENGCRRAMLLPVSGAFHSPLMVTAGDALFHDLMKTTFRKPEVPVVSNVSAKVIEHPDDIVGGLTMQVSGSVRWEESMRLLLSGGVDTFVELGVGDVLTNLLKRIERGARCYAVQDDESLQAACEALTAPTEEGCS